MPRKANTARGARQLLDEPAGFRVPAALDVLGVGEIHIRAVLEQREAVGGEVDGFQPGIVDPRGMILHAKGVVPVGPDEAAFRGAVGIADKGVDIRGSHPALRGFGDYDGFCWVGRIEK